MLVKWLGHASFLVKAQGKNIYIDPYAGDYEEKADLVLITHSHVDHCDQSKLKEIREPDTIIITSKTCADEISPNNVISLSPGEVKDIEGVKVYAVEAYNDKRFRSPGVPYHPKGIQIGFVVESEGKRVFHAGDSDFIPSMEKLDGITLALLPIMGRATMDLDEAVEAAIAINPEIAMPMHRRDSDPMEFKKQVENQSSIKVIAMDEGDDITL